MDQASANLDCEVPARRVGWLPSWLAEVCCQTLLRLLTAAQASSFFLTLWFPAGYRARIISLFMIAVPVSTVVGSPISGFILDMEGVGGLHGWQWMFLIEAFPALLMTPAVLYYLTDRPALATWLEPVERKWLQERLDAERANRETFFRMSWIKSMLTPRVLALGIVGILFNTPIGGLGFFLPQIVKDLGFTNVQAGFVTAIPYVIGAIGMVHWDGIRTGTASANGMWWCLLSPWRWGWDLLRSSQQIQSSRWLLFASPAGASSPSTQRFGRFRLRFSAGQERPQALPPSIPSAISAIISGPKSLGNCAIGLEPISPA
jgi:Major Facilitator Superfamily